MSGAPQSGSRRDRNFKKEGNFEEVRITSNKSDLNIYIDSNNYNEQVDKDVINAWYTKSENIVKKESLFSDRSATTETETKNMFVEITLTDRFREVDLGNIQKIQQELTSDCQKLETNIKLADVEGDSIKLTFKGSEEDLEKIKAFIKSDRITALGGKDIKNVELIKSPIKEKKLRDKSDRQKQLIQEIKNQKIEDRNLRNANLRFCNLNSIYLRKADLMGAYLRGAVLNDADLMGADLMGADLRGAFLNDADLMGADLMGADLRGAVLNDAELGGANLSYADLINADLIGADLMGADLRGVNLSYAYLINTYLNDAYLNDAYLNDAYLINADLSGTYLNDAYLINADLRYANLSYANLMGADLRYANLSYANLDGVKVDRAFFNNAKGLSRSQKQTLKNKGAIFEYSSPGDRVKSLIRA